MIDNVGSCCHHEDGPMSCHDRDLILEGVKVFGIVLVEKINKNPKIRIKLIYFYFEFSNKLFSMWIFIFLVFFFAFFYALKSVFNGDFIFSNFSF